MFVQEDSENTTFLNFVDMIGHYFDNIWIYIKSITDVHDKREKLTEGIAKDLLQELTKDGFVLESQGRGKYGRILGVLWDFDDNSINEKLIDAGLAVEYWGGTKVKVWGDY